MRRANSRAIGDLFAAQAGKFVSVCAGDGLETTLAAFGSGAAARSIRDGKRVMNIDIGGGTSKIAVCEDGEVVDMTAVDVGARIVSFDADGKVVRVEEAGRRFAKEAGFDLVLGGYITEEQRSAMVERMADRLFEAMTQQTLRPETAGPAAPRRAQERPQARRRAPSRAAFPNTSTACRRRASATSARGWRRRC